MPKLLQPSFSGGEIAPGLYGRVDLQRYATSLRTCRNFVVLPQGGVSNRAGTQFIAEVKDSDDITRLVPFAFNTEQQYVVEVGDLYARFIANGARIESPPGTPVAVVTPYAAADVFGLRFTQSADVMTFTHGSYPVEQLNRLSGTSFSMTPYVNKQGPFRDQNSDDSVTMWASARTGPVTLTASTGVFTAAMVGSLVYLELRELTNVKPWTPQERSTSGIGLGVLRRNDGKTYKCVTIPPGGTDWAETGIRGPIVEVGRQWDGGGDVRTNGTQIWTSGVEWEFQDGGFGVVQITGYTSSTVVTGEVRLTLPDGVVGGPGAVAHTWNLAGDGTTKTFATAGATGLSNLDYTVTINGVPVQSDPNYDNHAGGGLPPWERAMAYQGWNVNAAADTITFYNAPANGATIVVKQLGSLTNNVTPVWAFGAWSAVYGYPSEVEFFSDRMVFANSTAQPQTLWFTKIGDYTNFGKSTPIVDDDAITITLNSRQVNEIRDLVPLNSLLALTSGGEWRVTGGVNDVVTPSTVGFKPQSYNGISDVPALVVGNVSIFVQNRGSVIRDLGYQFDVDGYTGNNLSVFSQHLLDGHSIVDIAFQQVPNSILWFVREDGALLSLTYLREQGVLGWARHDTDGFVESICCVSENAIDALYLIVRRTIGGVSKRYIERMADRNQSDPLLPWHVDCGLSYDGRNTSALYMAIGVTSGGWTEDDVLTLFCFDGIGDPASVFVVGDVGNQVSVLKSTSALDAATGKYVTTTVQVRFVIDTYISPSLVHGHTIGDVPVALQGGLSGLYDWTFRRRTFAGLGHLEGKTVSILSDGNVHPQRVVTGGAVTLDRPGGVVIIGLPYVSDIETLDVNIVGQETIREAKKIISKVTLLVDATRNIMVGPDGAHLEEGKVRETEGYTDPVSPLSDIAEVPVQGSWSTTGRFLIRQTQPLPITVLAAIPEVS